MTSPLSLWCMQVSQRNDSISTLEADLAGAAQQRAELADLAAQVSSLKEALLTRNGSITQLQVDLGTAQQQRRELEEALEKAVVEAQVRGWAEGRGGGLLSGGWFTWGERGGN